MNQTQISISIVGSKLKCYQINKEVCCYWTTSAIISLKPIQIPFVPSKPCEGLYHNLLVIWTLKRTSWNWTTEKIILPRLYILYLVRIDNLPNICSLLIVLINCELITSQNKLFSFDSLDSLIINNLTSVCSNCKFRDKEKKYS